MEHFFKAMKEHDIKDHPAVKALVALGGLVGDAACDFKLDGKQTSCTNQFELQHSPRAYPGLLAMHRAPRGGVNLNRVFLLF